MLNNNEKVFLLNCIECFTDNCILSDDELRMILNITSKLDLNKDKIRCIMEQNM